MAINIQAKTDYSYLFSSLGSSTANVASSNFLGEYASIKNGSYAKLMKAYYSENSNDAVNSLTKNSKTVANDEEKKELAKVQTTTNALKESADVLLQNGSKSVFEKKDITTKDENGVEITTKGYDTEAIYKAVNSFVTNYNSVMNAVDETENETLTRRASNMVNSTISNLKLLNKVGITVNEDCTLSLDKETFDKADMNTAKALFHGNGSYAYHVSSQASMINFAAENELSRTSTYTANGGYNNTDYTGNLFNTYF